jgi:hypothetical protein
MGPAFHHFPYGLNFICREACAVDQMPFKRLAGRRRDGLDDGGHGAAVFLNLPPGMAVHPQLEEVEHVLQVHLPEHSVQKGRGRLAHSQRISNVWNFKPSVRRVRFFPSLDRHKRWRR